mgnify:CR=1 FL=1
MHILVESLLCLELLSARIPAFTNPLHHPSTLIA